MLLLNKKKIIISVFVAVFFSLFFFFPSSQIVSAASPSQVKLKNSPAVYFLSHKNHRRKAYINASVFLSYNNRWSDIKTISSADLANWPEAKLFKVAGSPAIYYIKGVQKAAIVSYGDLIDFGLSGEPIIEVSQFDLDQYQTSDYQTLGLSSNNTTNNPNAPDLVVSSELVTGANDNTLVAGTEGNLVGIFHLLPAKATTITDITFNFFGLFSSGLPQNVFLADASGNQIPANIHLSSGGRQVSVHFRSALSLGSGEEKIIKVFTGLGACDSSCNNQTIGISLEQAQNILPAGNIVGNWPLRGTTFKLAGGTMIGQISSQEQSLSGASGTVTNGSRLIGQFQLSETTGREDVLVKQLTFENSGTAGEDDWDDFRLLSGDNVIARASKLSDSGQLVFNINYLKVRNSAPVTLTILAGLKSGYHPQATFNLQLVGAWSVGNSYNLSLTPVIHNLEETNTLN